MSDSFVNKIYAGWLGKLIGVRLGAPVEMWTRQQIEKKYHGQHGYLFDYNDFAADDDTNGPTFFIRALRDSGKMDKITSADVGRTWLQYASWGHGMYWWGGYGVSSEHTAYENLRAGISAPASGASSNGGKILSEQIGGQIFIDSWGLVCPGQPTEAARLAGIAAHVAHDGEAVIGAQFVASCIAAAFTAESVDEMLNTALTCIPGASVYACCVRDVRAYYRAHPKAPWDCWDWIRSTCWKEQYPGNCHIMPNAALMIMALCYGEGSFSKTLELCNRCGFDTDCNVGNIGTMMGVLCDLKGIEKEWREPINDFYVCSSALGSLNITDAASFARELCRLARDLGHLMPSSEEMLWLDRSERISFFLPDATCGFRITSDGITRKGTAWENHALSIATPGWAWLRTYILPEDLYDDRYQPATSPLCYPGQIITARVDCSGQARFRIQSTAGEVLTSDWVVCKGITELKWQFPTINEGCIRCVGVETEGCKAWRLMAMDWQGEADYSIRTANLSMDEWSTVHQEIQQFTHVKGYWFLEDGWIRGTGFDVARAFTGGDDWQDYHVRVTLKLGTASAASLLARVSGAMRCCGVEAHRDGRVTLFRENEDRTALAVCNAAVKDGDELGLAVAGTKVTAYLNGEMLMTVEDKDVPSHGCIGLDVGCPGACSFGDIYVTPLLKG